MSPAKWAPVTAEGIGGQEREGMTQNHVVFSKLQQMEAADSALETRFLPWKVQRS